MQNSLVIRSPLWLPKQGVVVSPWSTIKTYGGAM